VVVVVVVVSDALCRLFVGLLGWGCTLFRVSLDLFLLVDWRFPDAVLSEDKSSTSSSGEFEAWSSETSDNIGRRGSALDKDKYHRASGIIVNIINADSALSFELSASSSSFSFSSR